MSVLSALNQSVYVFGQAAMGFILMSARDIYIVLSVVLLFALSSLFVSTLDYPRTGQKTVLNGNKSLKMGLGISVSDLLKTAKTEVFNDPYYKNFCFLLFTLNLVYGFISSVLPYSLSDLQGMSSSGVGIIKSVLSVGGIAGMLLVPEIAKQVTSSFMAGLIGSLFSILLIFGFSDDLPLVSVSFFLYGLFDSITQPLYSYTIKRIDNTVRGSVTGVIDFVVLLASPIGMFICGILANKSNLWVELFIVLIFACALVIVRSSKSLNYISI